MNSSNSSNENGKLGNTKQISPAVRWCFTLNNYTKDHLNEMNSYFSSDSSKYYIYGFEVGENGTPHLQGYIEFKKKCRPKGIFKFNNIHWEKAKGNRESNFNYCSKDGHYIINGVENKPVKIINNLKKWQKKVYDMLDSEPDDRTIHWIYETKGNVGKTALLKYIAVKKNKECLVLCGKANDMKNAIIKFFEKNRFYPKIILFNLPRSFNPEYLSLPGIEEIKDGLFYSGKYEGGMVIMNSPHIIICSNTPFDEVVEIDNISVNRWKCWKITKNEDLKEITIR